MSPFKKEYGNGSNPDTIKWLPTHREFAWGFNHNRVLKSQKKALRIITCSKYNAHTEPIMKSLSILRIDDLFKLSAAKFYYKLLNDNLPAYFSNWIIQPQSSVHSHLTRNRNHYRTCITRTAQAQRCLKHFLPSVANMIPISISNKILTHSLLTFSSNYKIHMINNYSSQCTDPSCYICNR